MKIWGIFSVVARSLFQGPGIYPCYVANEYLLNFGILIFIGSIEEKTGKPDYERTGVARNHLKISLHNQPSRAFCSCKKTAWSFSNIPTYNFLAISSSALEMLTILFSYFEGSLSP
jgi:hypothetical protein